MCACSQAAYNEFRPGPEPIGTSDSVEIRSLSQHYRERSQRYSLLERNRSVTSFSQFRKPFQ